MKDFIEDKIIQNIELITKLMNYKLELSDLMGDFIKNQSSKTKESILAKCYEILSFEDKTNELRAEIKSLALSDETISPDELSELISTIDDNMVYSLESKNEINEIIKNTKTTM